MDVADLTIAGAKAGAAKPSASSKPVKFPSGTTSQPVISLVVATVNRTRQLVRLLDSLLLQSRDDFEVIVVDQNPEGVLQPIVERYEGKLALTRVACGLGVSRARNLGISLARGGLICFPDDDCWYPPRVIADVFAFFETHPSVDMVLGRTIDEHGQESVSRFLSQSEPVSRRNVWLAGNTNALFVRRAAVDVIGGFDENLGPGSGTPFNSGEDTDFVLMALERRMRIYFAHDLLIHHDQTDSTIDERYLKRVAGYSIGSGRVLRKHGYTAFYLLYRIARMLPRMLIAAVTGNTPQVKFRWIWMSGAVRGYFTCRRLDSR
jgi:glycosyltransferase involved in cell wall biosynthesis